MFNPIQKKKKINHINADNIDIIFIGNDALLPTYPEQILLSFKESDVLLPLKETEKLFNFGKNSVLLDYNSFRNIVVKLALALAEIDEDMAIVVGQKDLLLEDSDLVNKNPS